MDKTLETVLGLCREPMLATEDGRAVYLNAAAREAFPGLAVGASAASLLPEQILFSEAERFVASARIGDRRYSVSCAALGDTRLFALSPQDAAAGGGLLSDGLMAELLSTLFNVGLASERVAALLPADAGGDAEEFLSLLRHGYHTLRRQLGNLNTARLLRDGTLRFSPRRTELVSFCADLTESVGFLTRGARAELSFSSPKPELWAWVDPVLVKRLLLNLLDNSFTHTPPDGEVRLRLMERGGNAVLSVDDSGEGIPPEVLRNIFTRYEARLDGEHLDRGASGGLGLGVASGLAALHGGALVIESREGKGTSVRTTLPLERPGNVVLKDIGGETDWAGGMDLILTELSGILGPECYTAKYLD